MQLKFDFMISALISKCPNQELNNLYFFHNEFGDTFLEEAKLFSHGIRNIHIPAFNEGAAVVDDSFSNLAVMGIGQTHPCSYGQCFMGQGVLIHIEPLPAGRSLIVMLRAVPRGGYFLARPGLNVLGCGRIYY